MDANKVIFLLQSSHAISYMFVSAGTLMMYDTLLVLPREITHIWSAKWCAPKALYLLTRYWGFVVLFVDLSVYTQLQTSVQWCQRFVWYNMTLGSTSTLSFLVNIILMMRLYALYGRSTRILVFLGCLLLADLCLLIMSVVSVAPSAYATTFVAPPTLPLLGCLCTPDIGTTIYGWVGGLITAIILFLMMAFKLISNNRARPSRAHNNVPPLIYAFYRDGTMTFFLIMCMTILGFVLCFNIEGPLQISYMPWVTVVTSSCGSRLILHLREAVYEDPTRHSEAVSPATHGANSYKLQSLRFAQGGNQTQRTGHKQFISQDGIAVTVVKEIHGDAQAV